ncbi:MAG: hypothetical protein R6V77_01075 [Candidatus Cloacimonadaceae bacterium]
MELSKDFTDSILRRVLDRVLDTITPKDDTPDDDGIMGLVKHAVPDGQDKNDAVFSILSGALAGETRQAPGSEGLMDLLSGMQTGSKQTQSETRNTGGLMDVLSGVMKGEQKNPSASATRNPMLDMITNAIGGEGILGDLIEKNMRSKGLEVNKFVDANGDEIPDDITDTVIDKIKDFVVDKVKDNLTGNTTS